MLPVRDQLAADAFDSQALRTIQHAVRQKYQKVARSAEGLFRYPTGREGALALGYEPAWLADIPDEVLTSFCGVGNPFAVVPIAAGSAILDVGCGAGVDLIVARRLAGVFARVCGIDLTPSMVERAKAGFTAVGISDIEVQLVDSAIIPYPDSTFDVVISNGVINLSPAKPQLFAEIRRVLRPGGRLQFADIILERPLPPALVASPESWAQ